MASKPRAKKKESDGTRRGDAVDTGRLIAELKNRIAVLENEVRYKRDDAPSPGTIEKDKGLMMDIASRKQVEEALRESKVNLQALFDAAQESILLMDPDGTVVAVNDCTARRVGSTPEELVGKNIYDHLPPDVAKGRKARADVVLRTVKPDRWEDERNGRIIDNNLYPVLSGDGKVARFAIFGRDVTEERKATKALAASEAKYRNIVETANEGIWMIDPDGVTTFVNPRVARMLGYSQEEIVGRTPYEFIDDEYIERVRISINNRRNGIKEQLIVKLLRKDGSNLWAIVSASPLYDGDGVYVGSLAMLMDITERKKVGEQLARQAELLSMVYDGVWAVDAEFRFTFWNKGAERILGWTAEEALGKVSNDLLKTRIAGASREESIKKLLQDGHYNGEASYLHKDGYYVPVEVNFSVVKGPDGEMTGLIVTGRDITERKRAEEALRESEERLRTILENSRDGINMLDLTTGRYVFMSPAQVELTGFTVEEINNISAEEAYERTHPDDRRITMEQQKRVAAGADPSSTVEYRWKVKSGEYRWFSDSRKLIKDGQGRPFALVGISRDITEQKRAEEALRESEARFREVAANIDSTFWISGYDGPGRLRYWYMSPAFERIFGIPVEKVYDDPMSWTGMIHPEDRGPVFEAMEKRAAGDYDVIAPDFRIIKPDGAVRWIKTSLFPVKGEDGKVRRFVGIADDVTEHRRAEEEKLFLLNAIQAEKDRLTALVNNMPDEVWFADADKKVTLVNPAVLREFGPASYGDSVEKIASSYEVYRPDGTPRPVEEAPPLRALIGEMVRDQEEIVRTPSSGELRYRQVNASPVRDASGKIIGSVSVVRDITERNRTEKELLIAKQQAELYLDLMGHDINNMHQVALGYLELAEADMPNNGGPREYLDKSVEVLQRSTKLISNVRKLQKLREGVFPTRDIDVCELLEEVQSEYKSVPDRTIRLNLNGRGKCLVRANELLYDVFANLVNNAAKHTRDGTEITVGVDVSEDDGRRYYRVMVEDNGPGIPDDSKERIFNRMHLGSARGMGLGLYLVRSLVSSYGGRVWAEDRVKGDHTMGARFVVLLPAVKK